VKVVAGPRAGGLRFELVLKVSPDLSEEKWVTGLVPPAQTEADARGLDVNARC